MRLIADITTNANVVKLSLRCPHCHQNGTLEEIAGVPDLHINETDDHGRATENPSHVALRRCPNTECHQLILVVATTAAKPRQILGSYPAEVIDFDATDLPPQVLAALDEAVRCHASGCYRAAAMMVRRTLELVCDERGAKGANLEERIDKLREKVILPVELFDALHDLRYLGNDAAHVTLKAYDDVGRVEVEAAIALTKEVLKALYQLAQLTQALAALKKKGDE